MSMHGLVCGLQPSFYCINDLTPSINFSGVHMQCVDSHDVMQSDMQEYMLANRQTVEHEARQATRHTRHEDSRISVGIMVIIWFIRVSSVDSSPLTLTEE